MCCVIVVGDINRNVLVVVNVVGVAAQRMAVRVAAHIMAVGVAAQRMAVARGVAAQRMAVGVAAKSRVGAWKS